MAVTFARAQSSVASTQDDPASATFGSPPTEGNLLVVHGMERGGLADADDYTISGSGWVKRIARAMFPEGGDDRRSHVVWTKVAGPSEPTTITVDDGTSNDKRILIEEYEAGEPVTWAFEDVAVGDTGAGSTPPMVTGDTASISGTQLLIGSAIWRKQSNNSHTDTAFTDLGDVAFFDGDTHGMSLASAFAQTDTTGAKSTSCSWSGDGHEGNVGLLVLTAVESTGEIDADASLTATATVTATAEVPGDDVEVDAETTAAATIEASAEVDEALFVIATITADAEVVPPEPGDQVDADASLTATATVTADAEVIRPTDATVTATATIAAEAATVGVHDADGMVTATASITAQAVAFGTREADAALTATASITATISLAGDVEPEAIIVGDITGPAARTQPLPVSVTHVDRTASGTAVARNTTGVATARRTGGAARRVIFTLDGPTRRIRPTPDGPDTSRTVTGPGH